MTDTHAGDAAAGHPEFRARAHASLARMRQMKVTDHEMNRIAGYLAGCELMDLALDAIEDDRRQVAASRAREHGPIEGQTVIALPGRQPVTEAA